MSERLTIDGYDYHVPPNARAEVERLRADNERLRAELAEIDARVKGARGIHRRNWRAEVEVERLRAELFDRDQRLGLLEAAHVTEVERLRRLLDPTVRKVLDQEEADR